MKKTIVAFILARNGSQRLKNKNLKKVNGISLVENTINFAKKLKFLSDIVLSSDSKKITNLAIKKNILTPGLRPFKLSKNVTTSEDVAAYIIEWYEKKFKKIDAILLLQPTTPFRKLKNYYKAKKIFLKKKITIIGATQINNNPNNYFINNKKIIKVKNYKKNSTLFFFIDGSLYLISKNIFLKQKTFTPKKFHPIINKSIKYSIDIDYERDLKLAKLLKNKNF